MNPHDFVKGWARNNGGDWKPVYLIGMNGEDRNYPFVCAVYQDKEFSEECFMHFSSIDQA